MKRKCKSGSPAAILMGNYYADGGAVNDAAMQGIGDRRAVPNFTQHFKSGGHVNGVREMENILGLHHSASTVKGKGRTRKYAEGGSVEMPMAGGALSTRPKNPLSGAAIAGASHENPMSGKPILRRAAGGAAKARKHYPYT